MPEEVPDPDEPLNRAYGVEHAEFVRPSETEPAKPPGQCDECGSADVEPVRKFRGYGLFLLLVLGLGVAVGQTMAAFFVALSGSIFFLIAPRWRCAACGHRWSS